MHLKLSHPVFLLAIPASIILFSVWLAGSALAQQHPEVFVGMTYDLILLSPLLYFLAMRKTSLPKITVIPVTLLGAFVASQILPEGAREHYNLLANYYLPLLEVFVVGFVGYGAWQIRKNVKENKAENYDAFELLQQSTSKVLGKSFAANVLGGELAAIYYAFFVWKKHSPAAGEFSYHKKSGAVALWLTLIFVVGVETLVLHLVVGQWSHLAAWILTGFSLYGGVSFLAHAKALARRPHVFREDKLVLRSGIFGAAEIPYTDIEKIEFCKKNLHQEDKQAHKLSLLPDLEPHNVALYVRATQQVEKVYGLKKAYRVLLFQVDDAEEFVEVLTKKHLEE